MDYFHPTHVRWTGANQLVTFAIKFPLDVQLSRNTFRGCAAMKTVRDDFRTISVAAGVARTQIDAAAHEDATFIYALAARTKHAAPAVITVEAPNGLALQMLKR